MEASTILDCMQPQKPAAATAAGGRAPTTLLLCCSGNDDCQSNNSRPPHKRMHLHAPGLRPGCRTSTACRHDTWEALMVRCPRPHKSDRLAGWIALRRSAQLSQQDQPAPAQMPQLGVVLFFLTEQHDRAATLKTTLGCCPDWSQGTRVVAAATTTNGLPPIYHEARHNH